jgi:hypothetical protein
VWYFETTCRPGILSDGMMFCGFLEPFFISKGLFVVVYIELAFDDT